MLTVFRKAESADAPAVADLYLASRRAFQPFAPCVHSDDEVRRWIGEVLIPANGVTVAVNSDQPIGLMALSRRAACGWIEQLYLHPTAVGRGIGSQLVQRAKQELGTPIRLYTFQANLAARRFYERQGFRPIAFSDGRDNEEHCPDILFEWNPRP